MSFIIGIISTPNTSTLMHVSQKTADMLLSELRVSVYRQLAACLQQCSHGDGDDRGEPWWVVIAETCTDLDITRQEEMDIGIIKLFKFTPFVFV